MDRISLLVCLTINALREGGKKRRKLKIWQPVLSKIKTNSVPAINLIKKNENVYLEGNQTVRKTVKQKEH